MTFVIFFEKGKYGFEETKVKWQKINFANIGNVWYFKSKDTVDKSYSQNDDETCVSLSVYLHKKWFKEFLLSWNSRINRVWYKFGIPHIRVCSCCFYIHRRCEVSLTLPMLMSLRNCGLNWTPIIRHSRNFSV